MDSVFCCLPIRDRKNGPTQFSEVAPTWETGYSDEKKSGYPDEKKGGYPYMRANRFPDEKKSGFLYEEKADYSHTKQCDSAKTEIRPSIKQEDSNDWNDRHDFNANNAAGILDAPIPYIPYSALDVEHEDAIEPPSVEPPSYYAYEPQNAFPDFPEDAIRFALHDSQPPELSAAEQMDACERREAEEEQSQFFNSIRYGDQLKRGLNELRRFQEDRLYELGECSGLTAEELERRRKLNCWEDDNDDDDDCMLEHDELEWEEEDDGDAEMI